MPKMVFMRSEFNSHSMCESSSWVAFFVGEQIPSDDEIRQAWHIEADEDGDFDSGVSSVSVGEIKEIAEADMPNQSSRWINAQIVDVAASKSGWWNNERKAWDWDRDAEPDFQFVRDQQEAK